MIHHLATSLPLFVCGLLSAELVVSLLRNFDRARAFLLVWSLVATVLYTMHFIYFSDESFPMRIYDSIYTFCNLIVYPLYLIYIYELTEVQPLRVRLLQLALLMSGAAVCSFIIWDSYDTPFYDTFYFICRGLFALGVIATVVLGTLQIQKYNHLIDNLYADVEERKLHSIKIILYVLVVFSFFSFCANYLGRNYFLSSNSLSFVSVLFSCLLFSIGQVGLNLRFSIRDIGHDEPIEPSIANPITLNSSLPKSNDDDTIEEEQTSVSALTQRLLKLVENEQLFLHPDLKLDDLVCMLGTNRTYLLRAMKQELQMSFTEYINLQRIAYARELMEKHPNWSKADIATRSGYSSLSSFYRNLKHFS